MANFTTAQMSQISEEVLKEVSRKSPWIQERRITTNGLTSRPKNLYIDISTYINNVANVLGINGSRVEYPYNKSLKRYRNVVRAGNRLEIKYNGTPSTGLDITAIADGTADGGAGTINLTLVVDGTTYDDHEIQTNDMVTIVGTTNYNGTKIATRVSATVINVSGTFGATETGNIGQLVGIEFLENHTLGATAASNTMDGAEEHAFSLGLIAKCWFHYMEEYRLEVEQALSKIDSVAARVAQQTTDIASARTEVELMNAEVDKGITAINSARLLINTNTTGPDPVGDYIREAQANIAVANGYFSDAAAYMQTASAEATTAAAMIREAGARLSNASSVMSGNAIQLAMMKDREYRNALNGLDRKTESNRMYHRD